MEANGTELNQMTGTYIWIKMRERKKKLNNQKYRETGGGESEWERSINENNDGHKHQHKPVLRRNERIIKFLNETITKNTKKVKKKYIEKKTSFTENFSIHNNIIK